MPASMPLVVDVGTLESYQVPRPYIEVRADQYDQVFTRHEDPQALVMTLEQ